MRCEQITANKYCWLLVSSVVHVNKVAKIVDECSEAMRMNVILGLARRTILSSYIVMNVNESMGNHRFGSIGWEFNFNWISKISFFSHSSLAWSASKKNSTRTVNFFTLPIPQTIIDIVLTKSLLFSFHLTLKDHVWVYLHQQFKYVQESSSISTQAWRNQSILS